MPVNHEVLLQTGCFGDDLSMIRTSSQVQETGIYDSVDQYYSEARAHEPTKPISPQIRNEEDRPHTTLAECGNKKHNLQILTTKQSNI